MSSTPMNYSPLRTLEEEDLGDDDLNLGPVTKAHYKKLAMKNRYHDLFLPYDIESSSDARGVRIWGREGSRKSLCLAFSMAIMLVTLVISAVVYVSSGSTSQIVLNPLGIPNSIGGDVKPGVALVDILNGKFYPKVFNGTWISDTEIKYFGHNGDLLLYDVASRITLVIVTGSDISVNLEKKSPTKCTISADRSFVLFSYDAQKIFRHSTYAKYVIYNVLSRQFTPLVPSILAKKHKLLQLAEWGPLNNSLVFVYANNIYYKGSALDNDSLKITTNGNPLLYNGVTDWVYEEEVFSSDTAVWFSPAGNQLAFVSFNDTEVDEIHFEIYGEPGSLGYQYPMVESIPYPKAGRTNPTVQVSMVNLSNLATGEKFRLKKNLQFPDVPQEHYVAGVVWASKVEVLVVTLNRHQNDSRHHLCNITGQCQTILIDQQRNGWIDVEMPKASSNGKAFLTLTSQYQGEKSYRHILHFTRESINRPMTEGEFSVDSILRWDEVNHRIYFTAPYYNQTTKTVIASTSHLYYVEDSGKNPGHITCVTCKSVNSFQEPCDTNSVEISKTASYFTQSCTGPKVPEISIKNLKVPDEQPLVWVDNAELRAKMQEVSQPIVRNFDIPIENHLTIKARIQIPPYLDPTKKYPLLVDVYAGPTSQKITDNFGVDWSDSLITSKGVIYVSIDGRGSGRQSDDLKFQIYRRLGTSEIDDQIYATEWLTANIPFIDANRTAIWGWSYGGYSTAMVMGKDVNNVFKCGISVAPVTNWAFYDTIYTERYMGLPTTADNFHAYNSSDVTNHIENFRNKKFYLIHGTADDNVHYQQSMVLSRALEKADILFRQTSYPDEDHGLASVRRHLYHSLEDFLFTQCF